MESLALVFIVLLVLGVVYKLGLFGPILDLTAVATRESAVYNHEHKAKVAKRYLVKDSVLSEADVNKINANIKAMESINFD